MSILVKIALQTHVLHDCDMRPIHAKYPQMHIRSVYTVIHTLARFKYLAADAMLLHTVSDPQIHRGTHTHARFTFLLLLLLSPRSWSKRLSWTGVDQIIMEADPLRPVTDMWVWISSDLPTYLSADCSYPEDPRSLKRYMHGARSKDDDAAANLYQPSSILLARSPRRPAASCSSSGTAPPRRAKPASGSRPSHRRRSRSRSRSYPPGVVVRHRRHRPATSYAP
jgi:hypothetical protein